MNTPTPQETEEAREAMARQRQEEERLRQSMLNRSEEILETPIDASIKEEARELMAERSQQEEQLQESMLIRAEAEVGIPSKAGDASP